MQAVFQARRGYDPGREDGMIAKLVSGGQTGVDRAALDVALELGVPCGGWCPRGRRAEDGHIPDRYPLTETPSDDSAQRTEWNVRDADATLVLTFGPPAGGTRLTVEVCRSQRKPFLVLDLADAAERVALVETARSWLRQVQADTLNVAGPRASEADGAYDAARGFLLDLLGRRVGG
jgi:hypothetical protein